MKIDLSKLPEGTKWIAIDEDGTGEVTAFDREPSRDDDGFYYSWGFCPLGVIGYVKNND